MLYQVVMMCVAVLAPLSAPVNLSPQFEVDDEDALKPKLDKWLQNTGYKLVEGTEPKVTRLDVEGVAVPSTGSAEADSLLGEASTTIAELRARNQELENTVAATLEAPSKVALLLDKVTGLERQLNEATGALSNAEAREREAVASLSVEVQKVADRDSTIASLTARIDALVAAAPADGTTTAPQS